MARTFGIDFFAVLSRGSQYRVESLMVRLAHRQNFIMPSPNREQVSKGCECACFAGVHFLYKADGRQKEWEENEARSCVGLKSTTGTSAELRHALFQYGNR